MRVTAPRFKPGAAESRRDDAVGTVAGAGPRAAGPGGQNLSRNQPQDSF
jgi:hypothetical protein